jgi:hypothetical protein
MKALASKVSWFEPEMSFYARGMNASGSEANTSDSRKVIPESKMLFSAS